MKFKNPLLVVTDLEVSKIFYREVLGLHVILDNADRRCLLANERKLACIDSIEGG